MAARCKWTSKIKRKGKPIGRNRPKLPIKEHWTREEVRKYPNSYEKRADPQITTKTHRDLTTKDGRWENNNLIKHLPIYLKEKQYGTLKNQRRLGIKYPFMKRCTMYYEIKCEGCSWRGTPRCPHNIPITGRHQKGYCQQRAEWFIQMVGLMGKQGGASVLQREKILENLDSELLWRRKLREEERKEFPRELLDLMKLNMKSIEGFRRQEEGQKLKIQKHSITPDMINNLVERKIEEKEEEDRKEKEPWTIIKKKKKKPVTAEN
jgi:hypothetical protein